MEKELLDSIGDGIRAIESLRSAAGMTFIKSAVERIAETLRDKKKLLIAGNGGSLCDAMHFAEELTGQFRKYRPALPAIAIADPGHLTCVSNDMGFESVFARGVEALGSEGDLLVVLTTSGNSMNLVKAVEMAHSRQMHTIAFLGKNGGKLKGLCDLEWIVSGFQYSDRIQEAHMTAIHIIIEQVEKLLFPSLFHAMVSTT